MSGERRPVAWTGVPGEPALRKGDVLVCPTAGCEFVVAEVRRELAYGDTLSAADLLFAGKAYRDGDATVCPECGADWRDPLTVAVRL